MGPSVRLLGRDRRGCGGDGKLPGTDPFTQFAWFNSGLEEFFSSWARQTWQWVRLSPCHLQKAPLRWVLSPPGPRTGCVVSIRTTAALLSRPLPRWGAVNADPSLSELSAGNLRERFVTDSVVQIAERFP